MEVRCEQEQRGWVYDIDRRGSCQHWERQRKGGDGRDKRVREVRGGENTRAQIFGLA